MERPAWTHARATKQTCETAAPWPTCRRSAATAGPLSGASSRRRFGEEARVQASVAAPSPRARHLRARLASLPDFLPRQQSRGAARRKAAGACASGKPAASSRGAGRAADVQRTWRTGPAAARNAKFTHCRSAASPAMVPLTPCALGEKFTKRHVTSRRFTPFPGRFTPTRFDVRLHAGQSGDRACVMSGLKAMDPRLRLQSWLLRVARNSRIAMSRPFTPFPCFFHAVSGPPGFMCERMRGRADRPCVMS